MNNLKVNETVFFATTRFKRLAEEVEGLIGKPSPGERRESARVFIEEIYLNIYLWVIKGVLTSVCFHFVKEYS